MREIHSSFRWLMREISCSCDFKMLQSNSERSTAMDDANTLFSVLIAIALELDDDLDIGKLESPNVSEAKSVRDAELTEPCKDDGVSSDDVSELIFCFFFVTWLIFWLLQQN